MTRKLSLMALCLCATAANAFAAAPNALQNPAFFPIAVWYQAPSVTGHSGPYPTLAAAAAAGGMNIFLGLGGWPESFGADYGELEAIKQNGLYVIGGMNTPWTENSSNFSVASMLALAQSIGAQSNLLGYNLGDEPSCGGGEPTVAQVPQAAANIQTYDSTRPVWINQTAWEVEPPNWITPSTCFQQLQTALKATSGAASFDYYPLTRPWEGFGNGGFGTVATTDYNEVPNDTLWVQGLVVQAMAHYAASGQRLWAYVEAGGDNLGFSEADNGFSGNLTAGSDVLTSNGPQNFENAAGVSSWLGLTVSGTGIPARTSITSIIDRKHARMSNAATATGTGVSIAVAGGVNNSDCVAKTNLCVVNGNEYRPTTVQVSAEVWNSIINGATGIEYFCHDDLSDQFCLGDSALAGTPATVTFMNLQHIDGWLNHLAGLLNSQTQAMCSMDHLNYATFAVTTRSSCASGGYTLATSNPAVPGAMLIKSYDNALFVIAQSTRRSSGGATYSFTLPGMANKTATIIYDSNNRYDHAHTSYGTQIEVNSLGVLNDKIGTYDDYQVKIYRIR